LTKGSEKLAIPKQIGHIWIGDLKPPLEWMQSWRDKHPDWTYTLYDNEYLTARKWRLQQLLVEFFKRRMFAGVSDIMRYELLYERGGFLPEADSICLRPTDELFGVPTIYSVHENEIHKPGSMSPFLASIPQHPTLELVMQAILDKYDPSAAHFKPPWRSVGNIFLRRLHGRTNFEVHLFPSSYFIPNFKRPTGDTINGPVYADQLWGSTKSIYEKFDEEKTKEIYGSVLDKLNSWL